MNSQLEFSGDYLKSDVLPALLDAAMNQKSRRAIYLLGYTLLELCVAKPGIIHPLQVLYHPDQALEEYCGIDLTPEERGEVKRLTVVLLDTHVLILQQVINDVLNNNRCNCGRHDIGHSSLESSGFNCDIPSVFLWQLYSYLSPMQFRNWANEIIDIHRAEERGEQAGSSSRAKISSRLKELGSVLDRLLSILNNPIAVSDSNWWPKEDDPVVDYSRKRVGVVYRILKFMANQLKDGAPTLVTPEVLGEAHDMAVASDKYSHGMTDNEFDRLVAPFRLGRNQMVWDEVVKAAADWPFPERELLRFIYRIKTGDIDADSNSSRN